MSEEQNNKLFVGNLSYSVQDDQLRDFFAAVEGVEVTDAKVIMDKMTGRSRGFGFVTLANEEMAQKAIDSLNGKELDGRAITVNVAKPQRDDNRRGGDRGFNRNRY